jgi:hypothetical protein
MPIDKVWQMPNNGAMNNDADNIKLIEQIAEETGFKPSTICSRACNDPLLYDRLKRRRDADVKRAQKLSAYREQEASRRAGVKQ